MTTVDFASVATLERSAFPVPLRRLLVAVDGTRVSDAPFAMTAKIAAITGADVDVATIGRWSSGATRRTPDQVAAGRAARLRDVRARMRRGAPGVDWPVWIDEGPSARRIAELARTHESDLVVIGVERTDLLSRAFRRSARMELLELSPAPILAVPPRAAHLPRRVVVAMDFGLESIHAADLAVQSMDPAGILYLVHVEPQSNATVAARMHARLAALAASYHAETCVTVEPVLLTGNVEREIRMFAACSYADLVAAGAHGRGRLASVMWATLPMRLLRRSATAVLIAPSPDRQEVVP